jgi:class 3 adenylate cyclase
VIVSTIQDIDAADALSTWLRPLGLERYTPVFEENDIDLEALPLLAEIELETLGLSLGHRKKLLKAIAALNGSEAKAAQKGPLAPALVREEAERRQLTVLFCDLVGSTELSRRLDIEDYRDLVRSYQSVCAEQVSRFGGHIAQYLGDGLLIYFGYPKAHEDDAQRAVRAALAMVDAVALLDFPSGPLEVRVGIHTGVVVVGDVGAGDTQEQLALGDTPNLAARLHSLAAPGSVVLSDRTRQLVADSFEYVDLGAHALKGIDEPVCVWQAVSQRTDDSFESEGNEPVAPMVGRELEFAVLLHAWERARAGHGQVVLLCGEPGIGKSRIWLALREKVSEANVAPWQYQCLPDFANSAFYLAIEYFERALKFAREPSPEARLDKLENMLRGYGVPRLDWNLIGQLLCLPAEARYGALGVTPKRQKVETMRALNDVIEAAARRRPVLMLFEDLHWADPSSLESLEALRERLEHLPLLLVATCRSEFRPQWIGQPGVTALTLGRLSAEQTRAVAARVAGDKELPLEILEQIVAKTDGIPLFVEELTKAILESGSLRADDRRYELSTPLASLAIPSTLRDSLMARLDRLGPIKEVAQIAACIGREFQQALLILICPLRATQVQEALDQLVASELVFMRGQESDVRYVFKHALIQEAAYDSLLKTRRAQIHKRIAEELERHFPQTKETEPELLAHHYSAAGLTSCST